MEDKKLNIALGIVISLIILSIVIIFFIGYRMITREEENISMNNNDNIIVNDEKEYSNEKDEKEQEKEELISQPNNQENRNTIDMSKYYFPTELGKIAQVYNDMLSACGKQKYIQYKRYQDDRYIGLDAMDIENVITYSEEEGKGIKAYNDLNGIIETSYNYSDYYGYWRKNTGETVLYEDGLLNSFLSLKIITNDEVSQYEFELKEDEIKDNKNCYKIIADYIGDNQYYEDVTYIWIDKATNLIIETEAVYSKGIISKGYFEYSDKTIEIPQEVIDNAQEM